VKRQIDLYLCRTVEDRKSIAGLLPERADVILAGAALVAGVLDALGLPDLVVSDRALRHGVWIDRFLESDD